MNSQTLNPSVAAAILERQQTQDERAKRVKELLNQATRDAAEAMGQAVPLTRLGITPTKPKPKAPKPDKQDEWPDSDQIANHTVTPPVAKSQIPVMRHDERDEEEPPDPAALPEFPITPLEYLLRIVNDPAQPAKRRDRAALNALPYMHKKQVAVPGVATPLLPGENPKTKSGQRAIAARTSHVGTAWDAVLEATGQVVPMPRDGADDTGDDEDA